MIQSAIHTNFNTGLISLLTVWGVVNTRIRVRQTREIRTLKKRMDDLYGSDGAIVNLNGRVVENEVAIREMKVAIGCLTPNQEIASKSLGEKFAVLPPAGTKCFADHDAGFHLVVGEGFRCNSCGRPPSFLATRGAAPSPSQEVVEGATPLSYASDALGLSPGRGPSSDNASEME